ncbi:hypothetical protein ACH5RR_032626 [Cinchona calisaya]|uniref:Leucine-rich repeat-containing N-terminal plant-type domain-containing protein n=1 Tax=Cinchona calisaya TaxID=153742 RepID=A0ABD2YL45_9GENT
MSQFGLSLRVIMSSFELSSLFLLILLFPSFHPKGGASASASAEEADALLKWKVSSGNQDNTLLSSWNLQSNTAKNSSNLPCTWAGIFCIGGSVNWLNLSKSSIKGSLDSCPFSSLTNLQYLDLSLNQIFGSIPPQIGNLSKLIYLDFSVNQLSGEIPTEIGNLENLTRFALGRNQLSGSIPPVIGSLGNLVTIYLQYNYLTGPVPPTLGNLSRLEKLLLFQNHLSGSIPPEIGNLISLRSLIFFGNNLTGEIPNSLGNLTDLNVLHL